MENRWRLLRLFQIIPNSWDSNSSLINPVTINQFELHSIATNRLFYDYPRLRLPNSY